MAAEGFYPTSLPNNTIATPRVDSVYLDVDQFAMYRDIRKAVDKTFEDNDFITYLETRAEVASASKFYNYEQGTLFRDAGVATVTNASATTATITLTADSYTSVSELTGAVSRSAIKVGDLIPLAGDIAARVNSKSGSGTSTTYVLQRTSTSGDLGAALALHAANASWRIVGQSNAFGEGTDMPTEGLDTPATRFVGQFQIIKSFDKITGDAASHQSHINYAGTTYYWDKMKLEMLKRHRVYQNMALMFGVGGTVNDGIQDVQLTGSLRSNLRDFGGKVFYNKNNGITLAVLDQIAAGVKDRGYTEALIFSGPRIRIDIENLLRTFTANGGIVYSQGDKMGQRGVDLGFGEFFYHGVHFKLQEYRIHPTLMAQPYMTYRDEAYIMPAGEISVSRPDGPTGASSLSLPSLSVRYKMENGSKSRRFKEITQDASVLPGMNDSVQKGLQSQEGLQQIGIRNGFFVAPAS